MKRVSRLFLPFIIYLFLHLTAQAQTTTVSGTVRSKEQTTLAGAAVLLLKAGDSTLVAGTTTDTAGSFLLTTNYPGDYLLKISYIGFRDQYRQVKATGKPLLFPDLVLQDKTMGLKEVLIEDKTPPAQQKGDTTQFNANAFKTNPDASAEDLVTKMPGITQQDGKVQAQGEDVKSVLVDGKPFFGDDPNSVLKNIPAEVIDKIQVFDRRSDQSLFTGFDDGNTTKTINIITRPQFRNGTFGKVFAGYGDNDHYKAGATVNMFKGKRRLTVLAQSNNINEQNFSMEDLAGVISSPGGNNRPGGMPGGQGRGGQGGRGPGGYGGGGRQYGGQGNDIGNFLVNPGGGLNTTHAFGLNYANQWKKWDVAASYFFNYTGNDAESDLFRQYSAEAGEGLAYSENKKTTGNNINHKVNLKLEYKIDSLRSVTIQPRVTAQFNNGNSATVAQTGLPLVTLNNTVSTSASRLTALNFSAPILFRNGFRKKGRTLSLNLTPGYNSYDGENFLVASSEGLVDSLMTDSLDQFATLDKKGIVLNGNLTYTEPLGENFQLSFTYMANYNGNESDKETFDRPFFSNEFILPNVLLTNHFNSSYFAHSAGPSIRYQKGIVNFSAGASVQLAYAENEQNGLLYTKYTKNYTSVLPNAMLMVRFSESKNLRFYYRSSNTPPGADQLQQVINNTNPLQLSTGNPYLEQDWFHFVNLRYSAVNTALNNSLFVLANFTYTKDYIGTSTILATKPGTLINGYTLPEGGQVSQPVNLDEAYSMRGFINYSFAIKAFKSNLNLSGGAGYSKTPGLTNGKLNYSHLTTPSVGLALTSNISQQVDFSLSGNGGITFADNSLQTQLNSRYLNLTSRFKLTVMPWKGLVLQSDIANQYYTGLSESYNENYWLWNAAIGYKFLKKQAAEIRLSVNDILEQNKSITRNNTDQYFEDVRTNVLQRYFMLTFTYNLKFYKDNFSKN